jgi:hypothetical protein
MPVLPEIVATVSFLQLDLSLALSCFLNKNSSAPLLFSQQDCCFFLLLLASHQKASWPLTKISSTPSFSLSCSLNKNAATFLFLASHQEPLGISPRVSCSLNKIASTSFLALGILALTKISWHLTKNLLASHPNFLFLVSHQEPLGISPRVSFLLTQEWVRPLALINLMREGEEFSNLTVEIRLDGWLRFGVSSLTLTLIIKLSFNLHLTN